MENHKHFNAARNAYYNTSFNPERRAKSECDFYDEIMQEFSGDEAVQARFEKLFLSSLAAKSRCASPMITGGAKFPVARNEKAKESERKHTQAMLDFIEKVRKAKEPKVDAYVKANDPEAILKLKAQLESAQAEHERLKALPVSERSWYDLPYALDKVKRIKARLEKVSAMKEKQNTAVKYGDIKIIHNYESARLQFIFDVKPSHSTIALMKKEAFKWSPTQSAWQRQLTNSAVDAARRVIRALGFELSDGKKCEA